MYGCAGCREVSGRKRSGLKNLVIRFLLCFFCLGILLGSYQGHAQTKKPATSSTAKKTTTQQPAKKPAAKKPASKAAPAKTAVKKPAPKPAATQPVKDFKDIKAPAIKASKPINAAPLDDDEDGEDIIEEELSEDFKKKAGRTAPVFFQPKKELSMVSEDTNTIGEGEISLIEISEELKIDCVWVKLTEYYSIWDSKRVNPYKIDNSQFKDTIPILLYDTLNGQSYSMPLQKTYTTSKFGMRGHRWHYGTDLKLNMGDTIVACFDGIVRIKGYDPRGYGYYVMIRHYNGLETLYGHMSEQKVDVGQLVKAGELIGLGGSTGRSSGPHLHFEVRYQGNAINPEDMYDFAKQHLVSDEFILTPNDFSYITKAARKVVYHKVRPGETLSVLSRKYNVSVQQLCAYNKLSPKAKLIAGRRLRVQ
jgi:murein DD-endopeptidase MepM/ murein hydrolase activator NlpD